MNENFIIKHDFTFTEYLGVTFYLMFRMKVIKRLLIFLIIIGILSGLLTITMARQTTGILLPVLARMLLLPLSLVLFLCLFTTLVTLVLYIFKPGIFKGGQYIFNHWGMQRTGGGIDISFPWSKFLKYHESSRFIFLYLNEKVTYVVQKRRFKSPGELEAFKGFIADRMAKG